MEIKSKRAVASGKHRSDPSLKVFSPCNNLLICNSSLFFADLILLACLQPIFPCFVLDFTILWWVLLILFLIFWWIMSWKRFFYGVIGLLQNQSETSKSYDRNFNSRYEPSPIFSLSTTDLDSTIKRENVILENWVWVGWNELETNIRRYEWACNEECLSLSLISEPNHPEIEMKFLGELYG